MSQRLSKSDFLKFLTHPCWLWLRKHDKSKLPAVDDSLQARFDEGNSIETFAEMLFPGGVRVGFNTYEEYESLPQRTQLAIAGGNKTLFQAKFATDRLEVICDVVEFLGDKRIALTEVKSGTSAKPEHSIDLAFQRYVLELCGYVVERCTVLVQNNKYVRQGEINPQELFLVLDVTAEVAGLMKQVTEEIPKALAVMDSSSMPNPSPRHCGGIKDAVSKWLPIFKSLVELPEKSIYDLPALKCQQVADLEDMGVALITKIPSDFKLGHTQKPVLKSLLDQTVHVDRDSIREFLSELVYPLYYLDYESYKHAIPPFDDIRPHQPVTTQYSLHVQSDPDAEVEHFEYIHQTHSFPCEALARTLRSQVGDVGSVIVWNKTFEIGRNKDLAQLVPDLSDFFLGLNGRVFDLMEVFSKKMYVHPEFMGSASIKKVLPVLAPELSYKKLAVQDGDTASILWGDAVLYNKFSPVEREKVIQDLLDYCELDTLAMVEIHRIVAKM
jgi:hypothetical protein